MRPALLSLLLGAALVAIKVPHAPAVVPDPVMGNVHSKIRVIIYQDLECPDCAHWHQIFKSQIIPRFGQEVGFEFRDYPLPQHLWSFNAAVLARFFDTQSLKLGMAWRDYCFTHQDDITPSNLMDTAAAWAAPHGIGRTQLAEAFSDAKLFALVQADQRRGNDDDVQHTPTVLLNGTEAKTPQQLEQWLSQAVTRH
ncbi:MAG: thioredoxin domain-containing protein [Terriglobales bacterium]